MRDNRQLAIDNIPTTISTPFCGSYSQIGRQITIGILLVVNSVLLVLGMAFVILTKDLKYKGLNDSVYIGVSVYSLVIFGAIAFGASEILQLSVSCLFVCVYWYIQSTPLNRVTSGPGCFDPIKRMKPINRCPN